MSLEQELLAIEQGFWTEPDRVHYFGEYMAGDAAMVFATGIMDEEAIIASLDSARAWDDVEIDEVDLVHIRDSAAVLAYRAEARRGDQACAVYASSVYVCQDDGVWRLVLHQQTPIG